MEKQKIEFKSVTGQPLEGWIYVPDGECVGVIQLVHGMAEHIGRYEEAAKVFASSGYAACAHTHLGHGALGREKPGYFGQSNGWSNLVEDIHAFRKIVTARFPSLPYFMLGHSMGSFLARTYVIKHSGLSGLILTGTGQKSPNLLRFGKALASMIKLGGGEKPSKLIQKLAFGANGDSSWLTRDESIVRKYDEDEDCGFAFTASGYYDMFDGMLRLTDDSFVRAVSPNLPILLLSGEEDTVGDKGLGVRLCAEQLERVGVHDVEMKFYPNARHEVLNEINKDEVYADILGFMSRVMRDKERSVPADEPKTRRSRSKDV
ncbi:MAG: lysophospholipase [Eubacteriales bacterium]|nr:lysophospholipase [Eubacteriales bacterium]MDD3881821.1 lysophospholipase [Eubacteriales bacterium]MDD4512933.1 lysophospholipase [Eubacteriales bacterium]